MKIEIQGVPEFRFALTLPHIDLLIQLSRQHYDGACKQASDPMSEYRFLTVWRRCTETGGEKYQHRATFSHLDLCLKIMEHIPHYMLDKRPLVFELREAFNAALTAANASRGQWGVRVITRGGFKQC